MRRPVGLPREDVTVRLPPFEIERYFAQHEFSARHQLSSSDCEPLTLSEVLAMADDEARDLWDRLSLAYTESAGLPLLRREIAALYADVSEDDVLEVVPEEGILLAMQAMLEPGDHVIVTFPAYQSLHSIAESIGCDVSGWVPEEEAGFDTAALRALVRPDTRMIVVNLPHNPTGLTVTPEAFREVADIAEEAGAYLFSDEMYRFLELQGTPRLPSAVGLSPNAVALGGLSKAFSLPGLRVGWLATRDRAVMRRVAELKDYTTICASAPSEVLGLIGLRARDRIVARNLGIIGSNMAATAEFVARWPRTLTWEPPMAGSVALARVSIDGGTAAMCERLVAETGAMLLPSSVFGWGDEHVRLGLGRAGFAEGLGVFERWLASQAPHEGGIA
jgi:aspartate/methionine/tyrosine aminotransferase